MTKNTTNAALSCFHDCTGVPKHLDGKIYLTTPAADADTTGPNDVSIRKFKD